MHKPPPNFTINRWYVYYSQSWVVPQLQEKIPAPGANSNMEPKVPVEQRLRNPPTVTYKTCHITILQKKYTKNMWMFSEYVWGLFYDGLLLNTNKVFFEVWWGLESSWLVECFVGESICCEVFVGRATRLNLTLIRMSWFGMASPSLVVGRVDPNWQIHFFGSKTKLDVFLDSLRSQENLIPWVTCFKIISRPTSAQNEGLTLQPSYSHLRHGFLWHYPGYPPPSHLLVASP